MNQAQKIRQLHRLTRAKICTLIDMPIEQMNVLTHDEAYNYLKTVLNVDEYGLKYLPQTAAFWVWWRTEWHRIDSMFLSKIRKDFEVGMCSIEDPTDGNHWAIYNKQELKTHYINYHSTNSNNIYINSTVMHASYHRLIKELANNK